MLRLIKTGFENLLLTTADAEAAQEWLLTHMEAHLQEVQTIGVEESDDCTMVYLEKQGDYQRLAIPHNANYVLTTLMTAQDFPSICSARALPTTIFMNLGTSYKHVEQVVDKIQEDLGGKRIPFGTAYSVPVQEGAIISFIEDAHQTGIVNAFPESLYIDGHYTRINEYLRMHAPRYLAKAYDVNDWHMVDVRIYDQHDCYDVQYKRFMQAINDLRLGYVVYATWRRVSERFSKPVGVHEFRLLTFMEPLELKMWLMGLEYDHEGIRFVDLNLFYHNKKISWRDVLDDKKYKSRVLGEGFKMPKSIFFSETSDKETLHSYCRHMVWSTFSDDEAATITLLEKSV